MGMVIDQYDIYLVDLDPTRGHEIQKTRPCLIVSPDEMNRTIETIIIAPMTTKSDKYPTRVDLEFDGKRGWIVLDQIRTVDKSRLVKKVGKLQETEIARVKAVLKEMLID